MQPREPNMNTNDAAPHCMIPQPAWPRLEDLMTQQEVDALEAEYRRCRREREALDQEWRLLTGKAKVAGLDRMNAEAETVAMQFQACGVEETLAATRQLAAATHAEEVARQAAQDIDEKYRRAKRAEDEALRQLTQAQLMLARGQ